MAPDLPHCPRAAGLYVHVPFCRRKCAYCTFYSRPPGPGDFERYTAAVLAHIKTLAQDEAIRPLRFFSLFFGGGTPSLLPAGMLVRILRACQDAFFCAADAEISIEVNPATLSAKTLAALRAAGFNRLSVGVQSFHDEELRALGRIHTAQDAIDTVKKARTAGFVNLSLDLMYGLPGQSLSSWQESLSCALALAPAHLSLYELTPEEPSPLCRALQAGALCLPEEDAVLAMMARTKELMAGSAWQRYEISNYARPGFFCFHNINYWQNGTYLGLGPGAVSSLSGRRLATPPGLRRYHELACRGQAVWLEEERLDTEASFRESVIMALRMVRGVSERALKVRYGLDLRTYYGPLLQSLITRGLLFWQGDYLALTEKGLLLANQVMAELV